MTPDSCFPKSSIFFLSTSPDPYPLLYNKYVHVYILNIRKSYLVSFSPKNFT